MPLIPPKIELPSSLVEGQGSDDYSYQAKRLQDVSLKLGVVLEVLYPEHERNQSKQVVEYTVMALHQGNTITYDNCTECDIFGGFADFLNFTRRAPEDSDKVKQEGSVKNQKGSLVLLLSLSANSESPIIVGALSHPDREKPQTKEDGHKLEGEFNGVNWTVDDDGAFTLTFKSKTDSSGKPQDEEAGGSQYKIEKDGSIEFSDGNNEKIRIDKTNKTIDVESEKNVSVSSKANVNIKSEESTSIQSTADLIAEAEGNATINAQGEMSLEASSKAGFKAADMEFTANNSFKVQASQIQLGASQVQVGQAGQPAVITTTQAVGTGNKGAPVITNFIGPFSGSVLISP